MCKYITNYFKRNDFKLGEMTLISGETTRGPFLEAPGNYRAR